MITPNPQPEILTWVKSTYSKDPEGPVLRFTASEWSAFIAGARDGEFAG